MNVLAVILILTSILVLGLIFWMRLSSDSFVNVNEIKAKSAAIPPAPDNICEFPGDIGFVSKNYQVCCPDGEKSLNCLCRLPSIKSCQKQYTNCLAGNLFSEKSKEFIGQDNVSNACKKIMDVCIIGDNISIQKPTQSSSKLHIGMKPDLGDPTNSVCNIDGYKQKNLAEFCDRICSQIPGCTYYHTDAQMGSCGLFTGKPVPLEKGALVSSRGNYQLYTIDPISEGFEDATPSTTTSITNTADMLGPAAKFCMSGGKSDDSCIGTHTIISDCRKLYNSCISEGNSKESCLARFGTCCSLIDSIDPNSNATMSAEGNIGSGRNTDILCTQNKLSKLSDCKMACLKHNMCDFINSNLTDNPAGGDAGSGRKGITSDGTAPYCQLFKGNPLANAGVTLGQKKSNAKTIYTKLRVNPVEQEANAALEKK